VKIWRLQVLVDDFSTFMNLKIWRAAFASEQVAGRSNFFLS